MSESEYNKVLGTRIRNFRKRAGLSQLNLELQIEASPGYLSRVENGDLNPTKETLHKISEVLKLNDREQEYLFGKLFSPATEQEVAAAEEQVRMHLHKKGVLAYLVDDRNRVWALSDTFKKIFGLSDEYIEKNRGRVLIDLMFDPATHVIDCLDPESKDDIFITVLKRFYADVAFMVDDEFYLECERVIKNSEYLSSLWNSIIKENPMRYQPKETMHVVFSIRGHKVPLDFSVNTLLGHRRFDLVEYHHTMLFNKILTKLFLQN